ncbi:DUF2783 domain-containing protein [Pseudomonas sp. X10]
MTSQLTTTDLENLYDQLADALDGSPEGKQQLMLVKLALLCAEALGDAEQFGLLVRIAQQDL